MHSTYYTAKRSGSITPTHQQSDGTNEARIREVVHKDEVKISKHPASCLVASLVGSGEAKSQLRTRQKKTKRAGRNISTSSKNLRSKDSRSQRGLHTFCWLARLQENGIKQTASGREIYGLYGKLELGSTPLTFTFGSLVCSCCHHSCQVSARLVQLVLPPASLHRRPHSRLFVASLSVVEKNHEMAGSHE